MFILVLLVLIYIYYQDKLRNEVSSLRDDIQDLNRRNDYDYPDNYDHDKNQQEDIVQVVEKKDEYTFQESQDRSKLGVAYDSNLSTIKDSYHKLFKENIQNPSNTFIDIHAAYKRLVEIENYRYKNRIEKAERIEEEVECDDEKSVVIFCGACGKQNRQERNQGEVTVTCVNCTRVSKIRT